MTDSKTGVWQILNEVDKEVLKQEKELVRAYFNHKKNGFFVEVGANEPASVSSQTFHLEEIGWSGILVEPNPGFAEEIKRKRLNSKLSSVACSSPDKVGSAELNIPLINGEIASEKAAIEVEVDHVGFEKYENIKVKVVTLDSILEENNVQEIDFLSIDVEGTEIDVLKGFDVNRYRPKLILIEDSLVLLDKHRYLKKCGYKLVKRTGGNNWYIPHNQDFSFATVKEKLRLFKKLYLSLLVRKTKMSLRMKTFRPFSKI